MKEEEWHGIRDGMVMRPIEGGSMKKQYRFAELSKEEKEYHEMILLEEIDLQAWYAIAYSSIFGEELFVAVQ